MGAACFRRAGGAASTPSTSLPPGWPACWIIWSQPTVWGEVSGAVRGLALPAGAGPLQAVTVTVAASTMSSAGSALMAKVHHLGPVKESTCPANKRFILRFHGLKNVNGALVHVNQRRLLPRVQPAPGRADLLAVAADDPGGVGEGLARQRQRGRAEKQRSTLAEDADLVDRFTCRGFTERFFIRRVRGLEERGWLWRAARRARGSSAACAGCARP